MIGDDFGVDIEGAKNAGIDQIYFNPDQNNNPFEPTYEVKSLVEICSIL